jgi:hypothetical protein
MALQYYPLHGRWGTVTVDGAECAEVTDVEGEVQINRVDVLQAGNRWKGYLPGEIEGSGSMTVMKANSWFEAFIYDWVSNGPASGNSSFKISLTLEDPHYETLPEDNEWGNNESVTLDGCQFWNLPVGYQRGSVIQRRYNFTFSGLSIASGIKAIRPGSEPSATAVDTARQDKL